MHITEITVSAGCGFNHPYESYANFKPSVTLKATFHGTEAAALDIARDLQKQAQDLVADEKERILAEIAREQTIANVESRIENWRAQLERRAAERPGIEQSHAAYRAELASSENPSMRGDWLEQKIKDLEQTLENYPADRAVTLKNIANFESYVAALKRGESPEEPTIEQQRNGESCPF